ncbi:MAG: 50S ribosomal protein L25 [Anaerolineales bacterium]
MDNVRIEASTRTAVRKGLGKLRREGQLPGVMYGGKSDPRAIQMDAHNVGLVLDRLQGTVLIDLAVDGDVHKTVVRDVQRDVLRGNLLHVDFLEVAMDQTIVTMVPVHLVGEAPVLSEGDYMISQLLTEVEIECLPGDLIANIDVSAEELTTPQSVISVEDLFAPKSITIMNDPDDVVARVAFATRVVEQEEEEEVAEFDAEAVEVVERGHEGEPAAEGVEPDAGE